MAVFALSISRWWQLDPGNTRRRKNGRRGKPFKTPREVGWKFVGIERAAAKKRETSTERKSEEHREKRKRTRRERKRTKEENEGREEEEREKERRERDVPCV